MKLPEKEINQVYDSVSCLRHEKILSFITAISDSFPDSIFVYTNGGCYKFYLILNSVFKEAVCYYSIVEGHVITEIGGRYYDITGEVKRTTHIILASDPHVSALVIAQCKFPPIVAEANMLKRYAMELEAEMAAIKELLWEVINHCDLGPSCSFADRFDQIEKAKKE